MKVGLIGLEDKLPNLALMKISAYHKTMGDTVSLGTGGDVTFISCCFSKYRLSAEKALSIYKNVVVGGPGWDPAVSLPIEYATCRPDYSLYGINFGIGRLTSGCPGDCPWCVVPACEGRETKTVARISDLINHHGDMVVLLDANILATPDWVDHFRELHEWGGWVDFTQGLDIRMVTDLAAAEIAKLRIISMAAWQKAKNGGTRFRKGQVHFAWDRIENEQQVRDGIKLLSKYMTPDRLTFYMLVGYNTTWEQDWHRFKLLDSLRVKPFVMLYKGAPEKLRHFARWVNKRIYKVSPWEEYRAWGEGRELQQALGF